MLLLRSLYTWFWICFSGHIVFKFLYRVFRQGKGKLQQCNIPTDIVSRYKHNTIKISTKVLWHEHCVKCVQIRSFFWSAFSRIRTEYGEILRISPYSVRMQENTDQKKLRILILFTQWNIHDFRFSWHCTEITFIPWKKYISL